MWKFWGVVVLMVLCFPPALYISPAEQTGPHEGLAPGTAPHLLQREGLLVHLHLCPSLQVRQGTGAVVMWWDGWE